MKANKAIQTQDYQDQQDILETLFQDRLKCMALFSNAIEHGLHTPLIIIRGLAEILIRNPDQDHLPNLHKISKEANQLLKFIEAMAVSPTSKVVKLQNISLKIMVDQVRIYFEKVCLDKGLSLQVDVGDDMRVESEPTRLKCILISLLQNAVDSFENVPPSKPRSIVIHAREKTGQIDLIISDTGSGMANDIQDFISNKLFLNSVLQTDDMNTGLALAQKMSNDLGLNLNFVSQTGSGTSFTISFPN